MILHPSFDINGAGHLTVCGRDAVELANEYGTPAIFIDEDAVRSACRTYKSAFARHFGGASSPVYAGKALCVKKLYELLREEDMMADCVSPGEIATAEAAGFDPGRVFFHGNNKSDDDIRYAVSRGIGHFVTDGVDELLALDRIAGEYGVKQKILLRIAPGIDPHTHKKIITGSIDSKFGSAIETGQAEAAVRLAMALPNIALDGLHCHVGSQIFDTAPFTDAADIMLRFIAHIKDTCGYEGTVLNLGGGFGVRYTEDDPAISYEENIGLVADAIDRTCRELGIDRPTIFMEPGRSMVAAAGVTLYTAGSVKEIPGFRNYVSVDGGMTDNPRYTLYQSRYTVVNASRASSPADFETTVAGRCCESGDLLAENVKIARPERGDVIAVLVTGAYNYSMASNYNRVPRPPVMFISKDGIKTAVRRETLDDMLALDE